MKSNSRAQHILGIYRACAAPLYRVLDEIPDDHLRWKPAPESRSISEIMRHLIRVDNWFLGRLGYPPEAVDPKGGTSEDILHNLKIVQRQIETILKDCRDDSELARRSQAPDAGEHETLGEVILHISQHYLYHLAQMVYLRRAQDRNWPAPLKEWENATHVISANITKTGG